MAVIFCLSAVLFLPLLLVTDLGWVATGGGMLVLVHLGLVATTLSYVLFARGLRRVLAATAVTLSLAEPLTAGLLGTIVLGESLHPLSLVGIGLMAVGLVLLTIPEGNFWGRV
jgi:DME family drug/metabolite transporter